MYGYIGKIKKFAASLSVDRYEASFINHNRILWGRKYTHNASNQILCELFPVASSIIAYSYFANLLAEKNQAEIIAYTQQKDGLLSHIYNRRIRKIFKSFNTDRILYCNPNKSDKQAGQLFEEIYPGIKSKKDVESLHVKGIWIGDLIYDSYLRNFKLPTIDVSSRMFKRTLYHALSNFLFWEAYLESHAVTAVILSHCVYYESATILRLAVQQDIPVFQVNATHVYCLNHQNLRAYTEFYDYPAMFSKLPRSEQRNGIQKAEERLQLRFSGKVGVDMAYSTKSAYAKEKKTRVLSRSNKIKVLIAAHCFFDSPHPYGVNLFPDFYEWLTFLGGVSERTDYEWYIKTHPDFIPANIPILEGIIKKYKKFEMIPADTSHLQLINEGISVALSVYGTIGFEYAALGMPVIYASKCNPCVAYDFNIHPKTIDEYERILLNLSDLKINIDYEKVCEFYYMRFIKHTKDWLFDDYDQFIQSIGGHAKQVGSVSYRRFLDQFSRLKHGDIIKRLSSFIDSNEYIMTNRHAERMPNDLSMRMAGQINNAN